MQTKQRSFIIIFLILIFNFFKLQLSIIAMGTYIYILNSIFLNFIIEEEYRLHCHDTSTSPNSTATALVKVPSPWCRAFAFTDFDHDHTPTLSKVAFCWSLALRSIPLYLPPPPPPDPMLLPLPPALAPSGFVHACALFAQLPSLQMRIFCFWDASCIIIRFTLCYASSSDSRSSSESSIEHVPQNIFFWGLRFLFAWCAGYAHCHLAR